MKLYDISAPSTILESFSLDPDVIVTQDLCTVCAVSSGELGSACPVGSTKVAKVVYRRATANLNRTLLQAVRAVPEQATR